MATSLASGVAGEPAAAVGGGVDKGSHLVKEATEEAEVDHLVDDDGAVAAKHIGDLRARGGREQLTISMARSVGQ